MSKNKKILLASIITIIVIIVFFVLYNLASAKVNEIKVEELRLEQELINKEAKAFEEQQIKDEERSKEIDVIKASSIYQKIYDKQEINILSILEYDRDDSGKKILPDWQEALFSEIRENGSITNIDLIPVNDNNMVWLWMFKKKYYGIVEYDLVIIDPGSLESTNLHLDDFALFYESFLNDEMSKNKEVEIITLLNYENIRSNDMNETVTKLNENYGFITIDCRDISHKELKENIDIYIYNLENKEKILSKSIATIDNKISSLDNFNELIKPSMSEGYRIRGSFYGNSSDAAKLGFTFSEGNAFLSYLVFPDGGTMRIIVNGELFREIDTGSENVSYRTIKLTGLTETENSVVIEAPTIADPNEYLLIYGVSTY